MGFPIFCFLVDEQFKKNLACSFVYGTAESRTFYRTPAGYTADKRRGERGIGVARSSYLFLTSLFPPPPPPYRTPAALPGAALSGLAERRLLPFPQPPPPPMAKN